MPYSKTTELPVSVKNHLPKHAQEIYMKAFNNAWEEYKQPSKRGNKSSQEETAHKVAWAAVEKKYRKNKDGEWIEN